MKIALTGSSGFIGKNLEEYFKKKNIEIITLGRTKHHDIEFDIMKKGKIKCPIKFKNIDILIHSASVSVNEFYRKKKINYKTVINIVEQELASLEKLIKFSKIKKIKKFIFISSASVYGKNPKNIAFKTSDIPMPSDLYGALKLSMEILGGKLFKNFISLRLFQVYGVNDLKFRLVPTVINSKSVKLNNCSQVTDMIFYKDLNNLVYKLMTSKKIVKGIFNAGNCQPILLREIVHKIVKLKKRKTNIKFERKLSKISNFSYANKKEIIKKLNWKPLYNINLGLKELINEKNA